jgi:hypothetical protein
MNNTPVGGCSSETYSLSIGMITVMIIIVVRMLMKMSGNE